MEKENQAYYSINEFAKKINVHPNTVRNNIKNGSLNAFKLGNGKNSIFRIPAAEIERLSFFTMKKFNPELRKIDLIH